MWRNGQIRTFCAYEQREGTESFSRGIFQIFGQFQPRKVYESVNFRKCDFDYRIVK